MSSMKSLIDAADMARESDSDTKPSSDNGHSHGTSMKQTNPQFKDLTVANSLVNLPSISYVTSQIPSQVPIMRRRDPIFPIFSSGTNSNNIMPSIYQAYLVSASQNNSEISSKEILKCPFTDCKRKLWNPFFNSVEDYKVHMSFHQCQWSLESVNSGLFVPCKYIPSSTEDALNHLERHIENDPLPQMRRDQSLDESRRMVYFCPIQTCVSSSYAEKGSSNRAHVYQHIRKHLG